MSEYYGVEGYWKGEEPNSNYLGLVKEYDDDSEDENDDDILFYGMSDYELKEAIIAGEGEGGILDFVITSFAYGTYYQGMINDILSKKEILPLLKGIHPRLDSKLELGTEEEWAGGFDKDVHIENVLKKTPTSWGGYEKEIIDLLISSSNAPVFLGINNDLDERIAEHLKRLNPASIIKDCSGVD